jgi:hypothetical protein
LRGVAAAKLGVEMKPFAPAPSFEPDGRPSGSMQNIWTEIKLWCAALLWMASLPTL